ncbi:MAG: ABC transporter permease [Treponema sp.]|nr:ABC transporter permease [Treponema sp.]
MKNVRWISFVAARYISFGRRNSPSPVLSVLGIATGVLALTVIISVMNGFQLGFIENILEISSGHLRLAHVQAGTEMQASEAAAQIPAVFSALPFRELNVLLRGRFPNPRGALIRGLPPDALERDPGFAAKLVMEDGSFDLSQPGNIVLGAELARYLSVRAGMEINLLSISSALRDESQTGGVYTVSGIFRSGFFEYDLNWGFINIQAAATLAANDRTTDDENAAPAMVMIKLNNRWHDQRAMAEIRNALSRAGFSFAEEGNAQGGISILSWREYNRAFFSALRTKKLMMFILLALIFIVVGLNIFQAQRRAVLERREEIGLLRALGASDTAVRLVFLWDGFIIGLSGGLVGMTLGLLIALNIQPFFSLLESLVNLVINTVNSILAFLGMYSNAEEFAVFSPQIFYIQEIPARVIPIEAALIFLFGFLSAVLAAWFASGKVSNTKPAEVLRYE